MRKTLDKSGGVQDYSSPPALYRGAPAHDTAGPRRVVEAPGDASADEESLRFDGRLLDAAILSTKALEYDEALYKRFTTFASKFGKKGNGKRVIGSSDNDYWQQQSQSQSLNRRILGVGKI